MNKANKAIRDARTLGMPKMLLLGLQHMFALFGGPANTTYGENTGVLELSKVHDSRVVRLAAIYAVVLSFIPKFAAIISTMPVAIVGGVSFILIFLYALLW